MSVDLEAIRKREQAATPGPWKAEKCPCGHVGCRQYTLPSQGSVGFEKDDADFIAHARTDIPALLAEIARLGGDLDRAIENHRDVARRKIVVAQWRDRFKARAEAAESALAACREENERLREGLKPFAALKIWDDLVDDVQLCIDDTENWDQNGPEWSLAVKHFRRARALVEGGGDGK